MQKSKKTGVLWIVPIFLCLFLVYQNAFCDSSSESNKRWHWFSALSLQNNWRILQGSADVVLNNGNIKAELYDATSFHRMTITGSIKNGKIKATAIRHGTDDEPRKLTGMITRHEWGRSSILLFENYAGGLVIGITIN